MPNYTPQGSTFANLQNRNGISQNNYSKWRKCHSKHTTRSGKMLQALHALTHTKKSQRHTRPVQPSNAARTIALCKSATATAHLSSVTETATWNSINMPMTNTQTSRLGLESNLRMETRQRRLDNSLQQTGNKIQSRSL
jgi:hypothetical protein